MKKNIGTFENVSGKIIVSDPCYDKNTWCQGVLENAMKGMWNAYVEFSGDGEDMEISSLIAIHEDTRDIPDADLTEEPFEVGVDSGQAGIFDELHYKDNSVYKENQRPKNDFDENDKWYGFCCDKTLSSESAGVIPFGVVSTSGFGDGSYTCYTHTNEEKLIDYIKIVFIDEELFGMDYDEFDEDEDEDDYDDLEEDDDDY